MEDKPLLQPQDDETISKYSLRDKDPHYDSNFLSRLFFYWGYKIIKLAKYTSLNLDHLGQMKESNTAEHYSKQIFDIWETKGYKNCKRIPLIQTFIRANLGPLILIFIGCMISSGLSIYTVDLFKNFMSSFGIEGEQGQLQGLIYGGQFILIKITLIFLQRRLFEYQNEIGYKAGLQLDCLVYNKILNSSLVNEDNATIADIVNYIQVDSIKLTASMISSPNMITLPFILIVYIYMIFQLVGRSFLIGFGGLIVFVIINFLLQKQFKSSQNLHHYHKDETMKLIIDTFNHIKAIKVNGWEDRFLQNIQATKEVEISSLALRGYYSNLNQTFLWFAPVAVCSLTIGMYEYYSVVDISTIFSILNIFAKINEPVRGIPSMLSNFYATFVSLKRIELYLLQTDFDKSYIIKNDIETKKKGIMIKVENGTFTWGKTINPNVKKEDLLDPNKYLNESHCNRTFSNIDQLMAGRAESSDTFDLRGFENIDLPTPIIKNINFTLYEGEFLCILGQTGSGKTSFLEAILDNMIKLDEDAKIIVNGSISYISQVPWISNDTVRNNILFHRDMNEEKYLKVLEMCSLKLDLKSLVGKDLTEIGENGINLSGGQKSRVSLARGFYADKDIYIFDEPTSAIDVRVGMNIMRMGIMNYLKGKTRILVTQTIEYASFADRIVYMKNGEITWTGTFKELFDQPFVSSFKIFNKDLKNKQDNSEREEAELNDYYTKFNVAQPGYQETNFRESLLSNMGLIARTTKDEEMLRGTIQYDIIKTSIHYLGGYKLLIMIFFIIVEWQLSNNGSEVWLVYWNEHPNERIKWYYFGVYVAFGVAGTIFTWFKNKVIAISTGTTSKNLHLDMVYHLVHAPLNLFHDITPKGQIINRLSRDINTVEENGFVTYASIISFGTAFVVVIVTCSFFNPYCLLFFPFFGIVGWLLSRFYLNCSRELVRLEGIVRSPVLNSVNETCLGSNTIRAYHYDTTYRDIFYQRLNDLFKVRLSLIGTFQWFGLMLDLLSYTLEFFLVVFCFIFRKKFEPDSIGLLLNYCTKLQSNLSKFLLDISSIQNTMISMERCLKYSNIAKEDDFVKAEDGKLQEWPSKGKIKFQNFSIKYRPETKLRLIDINFQINSGEKIGIIGRSGSGKSTIAMSIARIIESYSGAIFIDDVDIYTVGLKKLRNSLNIISQDLSLLEGDLRYNIDPLNQFTDKTIKNAMKLINFSYIWEQSQEGLKQKVTEGGMNFSMSEKQMIYITRALLYKARIIILDEFTSSLDYKKEEFINDILFKVFHKSTIIVIAHRIKTVMKCDKVMVLRKGRIVEYDNPQLLKEKKDSLFYELYSKSNLQDLNVKRNEEYG